MATYYMNIEAGTVLTPKQWFEEYKSMKPISWFGYDIDDGVGYDIYDENCEFPSYPVYKNAIELINDSDFLVEVKKVKGEWVEV